MKTTSLFSVLISINVFEEVRHLFEENLDLSFIPLRGDEDEPVEVEVRWVQSQGEPSGLMAVQLMALYPADRLPNLREMQVQALIRGYLSAFIQDKLAQRPASPVPPKRGNPAHYR